MMHATGSRNGAKRLVDPVRASLALIALGLALPGAVAAEQPAAGTGAAACLGCHENEKIRRIVETPHADYTDPRSPASREQCESCHGPSGVHMQFPLQVGNIRFSKAALTPVAERNAACLACHDNGDRGHWNDGAHGENLSCGDCHQIHERQDPTLVVADQGDRCGTCHPKIIPDAPSPSVHPLMGGNKLACTECHNPHGPTDLTACIQCHPQDAAAIARQSPKAQSYHPRAVEQGIACTACHKGFVHAMPAISRAAAVERP